MVLHNQRGIVGSTWYPDAPPESTFMPINEDLNISKVNKARSMLEFLCWDPMSRVKCPLSACSMPVAENFGGVNATERGNVYILQAVGKVLSASGDVIKCLIFDGAGSHQFCRKLLRGQAWSGKCADGSSTFLNIRVRSSQV